MGYAVQFLLGGEMIAEVEVGPYALIIGRGSECGICVPEAGSLSRKHAELRAERDALVLTDLKSRNGTFVNGRKITTENLQVGQMFQCGNLWGKVVARTDPGKPTTRAKRAKGG